MHWMVNGPLSSRIFSRSSLSLFFAKFDGPLNLLHLEQRILLALAVSTGFFQQIGYLLLWEPDVPQAIMRTLSAMSIETSASSMSTDLPSVMSAFL